MNIVLVKRCPTVDASLMSLCGVQAGLAASSPRPAGPPKLLWRPKTARDGGVGMSGRITLAAALLASVMAAPAMAQDRCPGCMTLFNGKSHTMDAKDAVVSQVTIKDGK